MRFSLLSLKQTSPPFLSQVYAYDLYDIFLQKGNFMDRELGQRYRQCILEPGSDCNAGDWAPI
jgi:Zn-dependent oligopeptidase